MLTSNRWYRTTRTCVSVVLSMCASGMLAAQTAQEPVAGEKQLNVIVTQSGIDAAQREQIEFPEPEPVSFTTADGIKLSATFYGGVLGKKTPVLILLHDLGGSAAELNELGLWLQRNFGYASLVPDLRGHGNSTLADFPDLTPDKFNAAQFASMAADIEGCKRFLRVQKNNEGLLNIDMLTVVAVGKTCILAVEWSQVDWSFPVLNGKKQGQDIKQLVLLSPESSYKGNRMASLKEPLFSGKDFDTPLNVWLVHDENDEPQSRTVESIQSSLMKGRKDLQNTGVYVAGFSASGAAIAHVEEFRKVLGEFVYLKLYKDAGKFPWEVRMVK